VLLVQGDEAGQPGCGFRVLLVPRSGDTLSLVCGAVGEQVVELLGDLDVAEEAGDALAEGSLGPVLGVLRLDGAAPALAGTLDVNLRGQ
jgi:hypothetical protein